MAEKNNRPELVYIKTSDLKLNPNNPRKNDKAVPSVMLSIQKYGIKQAFVCNTDYVVYCGNTRLKAARKLGIKELPCIVADDLTPEEIREYAIIDNKTSEIAEWDDELLSAELEELEGIKEFGIDFELQKVMTPEDDTSVIEDEPPDVEKENPPMAQPGDIWLLGAHSLICGDSTQEDTYKRLLGGGKVNLLITDPPYNVDYKGKTKKALKMENDKQQEEQFEEFLFKAFSLCHDAMLPGAAFYVWFASISHIAFERALIRAELPVREELIWVKNSLVLGRQDYQWKHEPCLYGWKGGEAHKWYSDRSQTTTMEFPRPTRNEEHPTMKPVKMFNYQIKNNTKKGDIVLDVFAGSGTTLIACEQNERVSYNCEKDPRYCDVIVKRYINLNENNKKKVYLIRDNKKISYKELLNKK